MIPNFIIVLGCLYPILPAGIHEATIDEIFSRFATTKKRNTLFEGFRKASENIFRAGCPQIYLDGSYVTAKPEPGDYDALWDPKFVDPALLDPVFLDFTNGTTLQKVKYLGEFFPASIIETGSGNSFLDFFQTEKISGKRKGIVKIKNYIQ